MFQQYSTPLVKGKDMVEEVVDMAAAVGTPYQMVGALVEGEDSMDGVVMYMVAVVGFPSRIAEALVEGEDMAEGVAMRMVAEVDSRDQVMGVEASVEGEVTTTPPSVVVDSMVAEEVLVVDSSSTPHSQFSQR